jgi:hypothetical protein
MTTAFSGVDDGVHHEHHGSGVRGLVSKKKRRFQVRTSEHSRRRRWGNGC